MTPAKTTGIDWNTEARKAADYVAQNMFGVHRGATLWLVDEPTTDRRYERALSVVFGNDGYHQEQRSQQEVEFLKNTIGPNAVLGFAIDSEDGYTWAMIVQGYTTDELKIMVELGWAMACNTSLGHGGVQRNLAAGPSPGRKYPN